MYRDRIDHNIDIISSYHPALTALLDYKRFVEPFRENCSPQPFIFLVHKITGK